MTSPCELGLGVVWGLQVGGLGELDCAAMAGGAMLASSSLATVPGEGEHSGN